MTSAASKLDGLALQGVRCRTCASPGVVRYGFTERNAQRYLCRTCGRTFIESYSRRGSRFGGALVAAAVEAYFEGSSLNRVAQLIRAQFAVNPRLSTIHRWILKLSRRASAGAGARAGRLTAGPDWLVSQSIVPMQSGGGDTVWIWDVLDLKSGAVMATRAAEQPAVLLVERLIVRALDAVVSPPALIRLRGIDWYLDPVRSFVSARAPGVQVVGGDSDGLPPDVSGSLQVRNSIVRTLRSAATVAVILGGWAFDHNHLRPRGPGDERPRWPLIGPDGPVHTWKDVVDDGD